MIDAATIGTFDIVIAVAVLGSALIGLVRGLFSEVVSLASWFAAFILAVYFAPVAARWITQWVDDPALCLVLGFISILIATLIAGAVVRRVLGGLVKSAGLSGVDRFLGFLFGAVRGVLVCVIALIALRPFAETSEWWRGSQFAPPLLAFEQDVLELIDKTRDLVTEATERV